MVDRGLEPVPPDVWRDLGLLGVTEHDDRLVLTFHNGDEVWVLVPDDYNAGGEVLEFNGRLYLLSEQGN